MLEILREQFGLTIANRPEIARTKHKTVYPIGTLRDLADYIIMCPEGKVVEVNSDALTVSNVSTISQRLKEKGFKLHCVRHEDKRILWCEKETGNG